jgi:hypothetical protein
MDKDKVKFQIVVSRFNEDLDWLDEFKPVCNIYNKGQDDINNFNCITLSNIGREGDTYLKYIVANYPNFSNHTLFTQAKIDDHVKSILSFKQNIKDILTETKIETQGYIGLSTVSVKDGWNEIIGFDDNAHGLLPIRTWWNKFFAKQPDNNRFRCNYSGIFMASKEHILFHSKEFYEEMNKYLLETEPTGGYVLERLWTTIFDGKTPSKYDKNMKCHIELKRRMDNLRETLEKSIKVI